MAENPCSSCATSLQSYLQSCARIQLPSPCLLSRDFVWLRELQELKRSDLCYVMMEIISPEFRATYALATDLAWIAGALCLPAIAWLLRNWFWMQIVITLPSIVLLACFWLIPESPRWLLAHEKADEAMKILTEAANKNGLDPVITNFELKEAISKSIKANENDDKSVNILQLFKPELRKRTCVIWFVWCVTTFMYYGISYNTNEFVGNPFINFTLYILVEFPASLIAVAVMKFKGRRIPEASYLIVGAAACLVFNIIPDDLWWLGTVISLFGKFCITSAFFILALFTTELFPTIVRNVGAGSASAFGRIGAFTAPFVKELERATYPVVPQVIFAILATAAGCMVLLLPETKDCSIPDTVKEVVITDRKSLSKNTEEIWILDKLKNKKPSIKS
ncbi:solute carrier family 22 member 3 [Caerostris darwini]|uniref:Solute carrier family 22 member 3 n=1 Tax=Caerostris darwini TaxID=1538125 RepID=A0AAV4QTA0_9ARAC|nr:solute carrier family 22 member 3 [Caerostris darwini]